MSSFIDRLRYSEASKELQFTFRWWTSVMDSMWVDFRRRFPRKAKNDRVAVYVQRADYQPGETDTVSDDEKSWISLQNRNEEHATPLTILLPDSLCLVRTATYPTVSAAELSNIIGLELTTTTPFSVLNSAWTWRQRSDGKTDVIIVKRDVLEQVAAHAMQAGITLKEIRPETSTPNAPAFQAFETLETRRLRFWNRVNVGLATALALLAVTAYGISYYQKTVVLTQLRSEVVVKTSEARALRDAMTQQEKAANAAHKLQALKNDRTSVVETWARVTNLLPPSAWLSELMLDKDGGTIVGFTGNAASLIEVLEQDPAIRNVTFATAIRIDPLNKSERFDIRFMHEYAPGTLAANEALE